MSTYMKKMLTELSIYCITLLNKRCYDTEKYKVQATKKYNKKYRDVLA